MKTTERAQQELNRLIDLFENGKAPEAISRVMLVNENMPCHKWTLRNRLLAFSQTAESDCRGFNQWKEINRSVKKGEHAAYILRPLIINEKKTDKETGEESKEEKLIGFGCIPVFALSQTDGEELPNMKPPEPPPLLDVAQTFGIKIFYESANGVYAGAYSVNKNNITLCTHDEQVFFHELAHAAHNRLSKLNNGQDARQEIVAELSACVLAHLYGKKPEEGNTFQYIKHYAEASKKTLSSAILAVIKDIEKVLNLIITTTEANNYKIAA